ncbi:hypothetical protein [Pinibacter soli]|uniref:Uncharacterized protein n=1 Tax=Pinibacter soli TaxID=3044211 RepID=A0ABT6RBV0_9BACT|nr:hypothetical protein [Pinibacter soli]MDI3320005.1 hypothetical protein [Pinibacter soli]
MKKIIIQLPMKLALWAGQGLWHNMDYLQETRSFDAAILNKSYNATENISIELRPDTIVDIYKRLSNLPEGIAARPNKDAKDILLPQLIAMTEGADTDLAQSAGYVLTTLQAWDNKQIADTAGIINRLASELFIS